MRQLSEFQSIFYAKPTARDTGILFAYNIFNFLNIISEHKTSNQILERNFA
jgi:hypothetical protein